MNLEQRINEITDNETGHSGEMIWQLIREVLEYVKPRGDEPIQKFPLKDGEPPEVTGFVQGYKVHGDEMEAKIKELGL